MQPVNVLPTFVSQDTDLKNKEPSSSSDKRSEDSDFSSLVDKHVSDDGKQSKVKETQEIGVSDTAKDGHDIAASKKNNADSEANRQESDAAAENDTSSESNIDNAEQASSKQASVDKSKEGNDEKSLAESEQFIALLYNSDQTLANSEGKPKQTEQTQQVNNQQVKPATYNEAKSSAASLKGAAELNENNNSKENTTTTANAEHKLKAFTAERESSSLSSEQVLKDYRKALHSQQVNKSLSIGSVQLTNAQLAAAQSQNSEVTESSNNALNADKTQLFEGKDTGKYSLPVEPIPKGGIDNKVEGIFAKNIAANEKTVNEATAKNAVVLNDNKLGSSTLNRGDHSAQLAAETINQNESLATTKIANSVLDALNKKASNSDKESSLKIDPEVNTTKSVKSKINADKILAEQAIQASTMVENNAKAKQEGISTKQVTTVNSHLQQQLTQAQQKSLSQTSDHLINESLSEEYVDAMLMTEDKPLELGAKVANKTIENSAPRAADIQALQATQANQTKQSNDAYIEHQASEVLNHTVASDTAQIQKNNVQLQQETISIFRKDFADAVKDKVMITINQKLQQFDITLDPPEFGNMQVRVNLQGEQAAVNFVVQNQQAKEALEQNMHKLRDMLAEQGVDVGGANVEQQNQQQSNDAENTKQGAESSSLLSSQAEGEHDVKHTLSAGLFDSSATGVDYYA